ncbi:ParA family protein [Marinobacter lutaoensis]|uniref:Cobalamin biosynthesis protein CobQ n=1 Tax=Marinobacter lutaoensis TaxID=135739 RepID=A0A1V2DWM6_9GAMM|nr:ParA family protein [Marinobacter lutaoensis]MBE03312.1 ParA family protein [Marinobacter sp.]MBI44506.1 ParA family protein [Oceanospirillales bacterium]NVD34442.1 ParA family protein [Marinobacter lutaoensis]ONF45155.1 cobalamin biosynthesis protein CobQ [Marinobacter lutaoensis]
MRIWAVANQKGGVGKTTTVVTLGGLLAERGKRVLVVDLDPHGSLTSWFGLDPDTVQRSVFGLFQNQGRVPEGLPASLVTETGCPGLSLMPASTALATLERRLVGAEGMGLIISRALAQLWDDFDYVILDNTPSLGVLMVNALAAAQHLVIPVQTEFLAIKGLERMLHTLQMIMRSQKNALPYTIVPTLFDRRTQASVKSLNLLRKTYGDSLWRFAIPVDTKFRDASQAGVVPSALDTQTHGVRAYTHLLNDLLAHSEIPRERRHG